MTKITVRLRSRIERTRRQMVSTYIQNGAKLTDPEVLRLSQQLDELLNRYEHDSKS